VRAQQIFDNCAALHLHLALVQLPGAIFTGSGGGENNPVTCLRSVLMKPEHASWLDEIWGRLSAAADLAGSL
jgi:tyrosine decarboxylase/aspartate 1-decarboxylase